MANKANIQTLRTVQLENARDHQFGDPNDGISEDAATQLGFSTPEQVGEITRGEASAAHVGSAATTETAIVVLLDEEEPHDPNWRKKYDMLREQLRTDKGFKAGKNPAAVNGDTFRYQQDRANKGISSGRTRGLQRIG